jgi:DNA-binding MarR family transcriptional regulator
MKYIAETLGIEIHVELWGGVTGLPYYLTDRYEFKKAVLEGVHCLFLTPKSELDTLNALKKHIVKVHEIEPLPIVLELDSITAWRRKSLIEARIPFVAQGCQIYLPFLGVALAERFKTGVPPSETLMPSSQLLFFHCLYHNEPELYTNGIADKLRLSVMQISRAVKQLQALDLISMRKDGVRVVISVMENRRDLFENARQHLLNPVRKKVYAEFSAIPDGLPQSGLCALSGLSMLNPPAVRTFAFFGKAGELTVSDTLIDSNMQAEVEVWRYDPTILSDNADMVDTLSLIASMQADDDARVERAVEVALSEVWR